MPEGYALYAINVGSNQPACGAWITNPARLSIACVKSCRFSGPVLAVGTAVAEALALAEVDLTEAEADADLLAELLELVSVLEVDVVVVEVCVVEVVVCLVVVGGACVVVVVGGGGDGPVPYDQSP